MLNLKSMRDEEFCVIVKPPVARISMQVTIDEGGNVSLSAKLAEQFAKKPVQIRLNQEATAIQIACVEEFDRMDRIVFPKNGRKKIPDAYEILKRQLITFPVIFSSYDLPENEKWRGGRQENPTTKPLTSSRSAKKK